MEGVPQGLVLVGTFFMVAEEYLPPTAAPGTWALMTMQPNISMQPLSVPHECWDCIDTFFGFLRIFNMKLWPWRVMTYHGGSHF